MDKKIAIIGHGDHGKTTLTEAMQSGLGIEIRETKTIHEIIEDNRSIPYHAPPKIDLTPYDFKSGRESRRERRVKERKSKKK